MWRGGLRHRLSIAAQLFRGSRNCSFVVQLGEEVGEGSTAAGCARPRIVIIRVLGVGEILSAIADGLSVYGRDETWAMAHSATAYYAGHAE